MEKVRNLSFPTPIIIISARLVVDRLRITVAYAGEPPAAAYFCGRRAALKPLADDPERVQLVMLEFLRRKLGRTRGDISRGILIFFDLDYKTASLYTTSEWYESV